MRSNVSVHVDIRLYISVTRGGAAADDAGTACVGGQSTSEVHR